MPKNSLCALTIAFEEVQGDDHEAEGNGFELNGLLPIFDPPSEVKTPRKLSMVL